MHAVFFLNFENVDKMAPEMDAEILIGLLSSYHEITRKYCKT